MNNDAKKNIFINNRFELLISSESYIKKDYQVATIVTPPFAISPIFTCTLALNGNKKSTLEPNLIKPISSVCFTC